MDRYLHLASYNVTPFRIQKLKKITPEKPYVMSNVIAKVYQFK